jgi:hypothetical protein
MTTNDKTTNSNTNPGDAGNAAAKGETTASSKAAAIKKQQQLNSFHVIRILEVRATVFFTSKIHALNT